MYMRTLSLSLLLLLLSAGVNATGHDPGFSSRLPEDTSIYITTERLGEIIQTVGESNFYDAFYSIPIVAAAVDSGEMPDVKTMWSDMMESPEGAMIRPMLSLLEDEVVVASLGDGSRGIVPGFIHLIRMALLSQEYRMGGMAEDVKTRLHQTAQDLSERFGIEPMVLAFKTEQKETVAPLISALLLQLPPDIAPLIQPEEIEGIPFSVLSLAPSAFFPADSLVKMLSSAVDDQATLDAIGQMYAELTVIARLGWIDNYLVFVLEDQTDTCVDDLIKGPGSGDLGSLPELNKIMADIGDHPMRRVVFNMRSVHTAMKNQVEELVADMHVCPTIMGMVAITGLTAETAGEKLTTAVDKLFDPTLMVLAVELEHGFRIVGDSYWATDSDKVTEGLKEITLEQRIPESSLGWLVWGAEEGATQWKKGLEEQIKFRRMPIWSLIQMQQEPKQRMVQQKITDMMVIMHDHLADAMGQEGMLVMGWEGDLESFKDTELGITIPEFSIALEIVDREKVHETADKIGAKIGEILSHGTDTTLSVPPAEMTKVKDGEKYVWKDVIPSQGAGLIPTAYLTKNHVIVSTSERLADELFETIGKGKDTNQWPVGELSELMKDRTHQAGVLKMNKAIRNTLEMILSPKLSEMTEAEDEEMQAIRDNMPAFLDLTDVFGNVWYHETGDENASRFTAHIEIHDLQ